LETWAEIRNRHQQEKIALVKSLADDYTYAEASNILKWDAKSLVRFCHYWQINFKRSQKGGYTNAEPYISRSRTFAVSAGASRSFAR
jgi:hypothetical protein